MTRLKDPRLLSERPRPRCRAPGRLSARRLAVGRPGRWQGGVTAQATGPPAPPRRSRPHHGAPAAPTTTTTVAPTPGHLVASSTRGSSSAGPTSTSFAPRSPPASSRGRALRPSLDDSGSSSRPRAGPTSYRYTSLSYSPAPVPVIQAASGSHTTYIQRPPELGFAGHRRRRAPGRRPGRLRARARCWPTPASQANAAKAIEIMNAWSSTLTEIKFDQPRQLGQRLPGLQQRQAPGGLGRLPVRPCRRDHPLQRGGLVQPGDVARFETHAPQRLPAVDDHRLGRTGANWMMTFAEATIAIGVFTNNRATFNAGVAAWRQKSPTTIYMPDATDRCPVATRPVLRHRRRACRRSGTSPPRTSPGSPGETLRDLSHMAMGLGAMSNGAADRRASRASTSSVSERARIVAGYERNAGYVNAYLDKVASLGGAQPPSDWRAHRLGRPVVQRRGGRLHGRLGGRLQPLCRWTWASRCPTPSVS